MPKGFKKAIEKQKSVLKMRREKAAFEENGGYTDETWKAAKEKYKGGVKPFSFQTGERVVKRREAKLFMDVKLSRSKKGRIGLCDGDRPAGEERRGAKRRAGKARLRDIDVLLP